MPETIWRARRAFTLVEVMVAVVILAVALVALQGGTALLVRAIADAEREERAVALAARREALIVAACTDGAGSESAGGASVVWSASRTGGITSVALSARAVTRRGPLARSFTITTRCP